MIVREFTDDMVGEVRRFNARLRTGGVKSQFPTSPVPAWLPKLAGRRLFQEHYLAVDDTAAVRGAYILKHQDFWIKDEVLSIGDFHLPISEGVVNKSYPQVAVQLLRHAIQKQPLLFGLGIGGYDESLAGLLDAAKWSMFSVPFFFRVGHPSAFLRNISYFRRKASGRCLLDVCAGSGLGWLCIRAVQAVACRKAPPRSRLGRRAGGRVLHLGG